jgi:hypothetical protein
MEYPITHAPLVSSRVSLERPGHEICDTWDLWRERWPNPRIVSHPGSDPAPGRKLGWLSADGAPCAIMVPVAIALGTRAIWLSLHTWDGIHWLSVTLGGGSGLRSPGGLYGRRWSKLYVLCSLPGVQWCDDAAGGYPTLSHSLGTALVFPAFRLYHGPRQDNRGIDRSLCRMDCCLIATTISSRRWSWGYSNDC